nr:MAG TPA: hypothetical protein [Caudoviricetes sp.]
MGKPFFQSKAPNSVCKKRSKQAPPFVQLSKIRKVRKRPLTSN